MTVMGTPYHQHEFEQDPRWPGREPSWAATMFATASYLGAIVTGPVVPLIIYLGGRYSSDFVRGHAAQALNVTLTVLLYAVSGTIAGVVLAFDSATAAFIVMLPIAIVVWVTMVVHLVRGASAAIYGEFRQIPSWICAGLVR